MRKAINNLQATKTGFKKITKQNVFDVCDVPNLDKLKKIIDLCSQSNFDEALKLTHEIWKEGYMAYDIVNNFSRLM